MAAVAGVATKLLGGSVGNIVGGVASQLVGGGGLDKIFGGIKNAFGKLFGKKRAKRAHRPHVRPHPPQPQPTAFQNMNNNLIQSAGKIDEMMSKAKELAGKDDKKSQLEAQELMQNAQNMFTLFSNLIKAQGEMARTAFQNIR